MDSGKRAGTIGTTIFGILGLGLFVFIILNASEANWIFSSSDVAYLYLIYYVFLLFIDSCLITAAISLYFQKSFIKVGIVALLIITVALFLSATIQRNIKLKKATEAAKQNSIALNKDIEKWLSKPQPDKAKIEKLTTQYNIAEQARFFSAGKDAFYILNQDGSPQKIESSGNLNILPSKKSIFALSGENKEEVVDPVNNKKISLQVELTNRNKGVSGIELIGFSSDYKYLISSLWFSGNIDYSSTAYYIRDSLSNVAYSENVFIILNIDDGSVQYVRGDEWPSFCSTSLPANSCSDSKPYSFDEKSYSDTSKCESIINQQRNSNYGSYNKLMDGYDLDSVIYPACMIEGDYYLAAMSKSEPSDGRLRSVNDAYPQEDYSIMKIDNGFTNAQKIIEIPNSNYPNTEPETWYLQNSGSENIFFEVTNHGNNTTSVVYFDRKSGEYKTIDQPSGKENRRLLEITRK